MVNLSSRKRRRESSLSSECRLEREYIVAAILDKRIRGKKTQYLLKWKGYSTADNTWEDESRLNCPELLNQFEEDLDNQSKTNESTSNSKNSNHTSIEDDIDDSQSDEYKSVSNETGTESTKNDDNDDGDEHITRMPTRFSPRKKVLALRPARTRRRSSRKIVNQTNSRITFTPKNESSNEDDVAGIEDDQPSSSSTTLKKKTSTSPKRKISSNGKSPTTAAGNKNNNSVRMSKKSAAHEQNVNEAKTINLRLRIAPNSNSSISVELDENAHRKDKTSLENDRNVSELLDETDQVEQIEAVRNNQHGIAFRIKLINENHSHWIPSKVANRKYPQAIIAFWESHVEFM